MSISLNDMPLKELRELQSQVAKAIGSFEDRKKKQAIAALDEHAREMGFSLAELTGTPTVRKRAPATAKFANPADRTETWSGRGRKPRWFAAAMAAGKSPADLAI